MELIERFADKLARDVREGRVFTGAVWSVGALAWWMGATGDVGLGIVFLVSALVMTEIREPVFFFPGK